MQEKLGDQCRVQSLEQNKESESEKTAATLGNNFVVQFIGTIQNASNQSHLELDGISLNWSEDFICVSLKVTVSINRAKLNYTFGVISEA